MSITCAPAGLDFGGRSYSSQIAGPGTDVRRMPSTRTVDDPKAKSKSRAGSGTRAPLLAQRTVRPVKMRVLAFQRPPQVASVQSEEPSDLRSTSSIVHIELVHSVIGVVVPGITCSRTLMRQPFVTASAPARQARMAGSSVRR